MSKKYDFSAFDTPQKNLDFTAFDSREVAAVPTEPKLEDISMGESALRGGAQGLTFSLADEIEGAVHSPMGGAKSLLGLLGVDQSGDEDVQAYMDARNQARAEYEAAEAANPGSYLAGNLVSGIIPGAGITKLVGPAAKGLSLAKGAMGPLNKASALQNLSQAMKVGGVAGAAIGAGTSQAELAQGKGNELVSDIVEGGLVGAGTGGVVQGGIELGKGAISGGKGFLDMIGKTKTAQRFSKAKNYGKEGIDLVSEEGLEKAGQDVISGASELGLKAKEVYQNAGTAMREAKKAIEASGKTFNIKDQIDKIDDTIKQLMKSDDPQALKDIQKLTEYLDNLRLGKNVDVEFTPLTPKTIKETATTVFDQLPVNKVKGSFENSPEGKMKAQNILSKLTAKAQQEGSDAAYELVDDLDNGFYHVVEKSTKQIEQQIPGETVSKFVPGATKTLQTRSGGTNLEETSVDKVQEIIDTLNRYSGTSSKSGVGVVETTPAINTLKQVAGGLKNEILENSQLAGANKQSNAAFQAMENLGLGIDDFIKDAQTGKIRLTQQAQDKLTNLVRKSGTDTSSGITADQKLKESLRLLGVADDKAAKELAPKLEKAADVLDLSQQAQNIKFFKSSFLEKGPVRAGNFIGLKMKDMKDKSPEFWNKVGTDLEALGGANARVGKIIKDISTKDDQARNAMLFSLQQQPWAREVLDGIFEKEETK